MRLFVCAGEASGDAYGAALIHAVRGLPGGSDASFEGIGGSMIRATGAAIVADSSRWGAIGIVKALGVVPRVTFGAYLAYRRLKAGRPGLFVPIDFGYLNIRLARAAKRLGWKVLYFIPPGSWRRDRQGRDLAAITDAVVSPFSWSADMLRAMGANAHWFGHPIKSMAGGLSRQAEGARSGVAILPGSRAHEVEQNLPAIAKAIEGLPPVEFAVAPTVDLAGLRRIWGSLTTDRTDTFTPDDVFGVLRRARAAVVCSGTATLQAAVCRCPMVVVYKVSKMMAIEGRLLGLHKGIGFISLPNIFLDRAAVPELVHTNATPEAIRAHLDSLLGETPERAGQLAAFEELDGILGPDDCIERTAELIVEMLGVDRSSHVSTELRERENLTLNCGKGYLRPEQEEGARRVQRQSGTTDLGKVLVELGMVGEREVAQAKAQELGYNFVDLDRYLIDTYAIQSLDAATCRRLTIMPVKRDGMNLYVAMVDASHIETLDEVRLESGCRVILVLALRDALLAAIAKCYGP